MNNTARILKECEKFTFSTATAIDTNNAKFTGILWPF